jgi:RND family efflux transporter MFP subunit
VDRKLAIGVGVAALAVVGVYAATAGDDDGNPPPAARPGRQPAAVPPRQVARLDTAVTPPALDSTRPTDCLIEPSQVVRVNSGVEGVIQAIYVERGDTVSRGQVVAQLRSDVDRAGSAAAQARANNVYATRAAEARAAYLESVRQRSEQISQYLARDKVEEAQANARAAADERAAASQDQKVAQLEYVRTQRVMSEKTVRSPVSGIVTERAMSPGEYRGPDASHILTIAQVDPLNVEVFAPIAQLGSIKLGDELTVHPEDPVGGSYRARVKIIDRVFDAASGTFGMRLELPNPGYKLPAGLRCRIAFDNGNGKQTTG